MIEKGLGDDYQKVPHMKNQPNFISAIGSFIWCDILYFDSWSMFYTDDFVNSPCPLYLIHRYKIYYRYKVYYIIRYI